MPSSSSQHFSFSFSWLLSRLLLLVYNQMINKLLDLPNASDAYMRSGGVLLVLEEGVAMICHSQILSLHSSVFFKMFEDLASKHDKRTRIPLSGFTESQCSDVLAYLYHNGVASRNAVFWGTDRQSLEEAVAVTRFAHAYDVQHALRHVEAYLTAHVKACCDGKECGDGRTSKKCSTEELLAWALMADKFDMHELCGHCDRAMMMEWEHFQDKPEQADQLSSSALQRIAKGLNKALLVAGRHYSRQYPDVKGVIAWRRQKQSADE